MESVRECPSSVLLLVLALSLMIAVSAEDLFLGKPNQGSAWELPLQHAAPCDHFSLVCGEEKGDNFKSSGLEADFNILSKGDPPIEKEPLCTVNCFRADPVCGSDGVTYWCGVAEAKCAKVEVAHEGYCDIWNGGTKANLGLHAAQSLQLVHMVWLVLAGLLIVIGLL